MPWQFLKQVSFIPSSLALKFIFSTKLSVLPHKNSAIATVQSFAETTHIHFSISSTVRVSVVVSQTWDPPIELAFWLHGTLSVNCICPESRASIISKRDIILVTLAGLSFSWILCSYKTCPESWSIRIADADCRFRLDGELLLIAELSGVDVCFVLMLDDQT